MEIYESQFKLKPGVDNDEGIRLFKELAVPIYRKIPGCISATIFRYMPIGDTTPEWDGAFVEVWESKEAHDKALSDRYIGSGEDNELAKTGFYAKVGQMIEKSSDALAIPVASTR
jgi:quinol monooxygenase YgiN